MPRHDAKINQFSKYIVLVSTEALGMYLESNYPPCKKEEDGM